LLENLSGFPNLGMGGFGQNAPEPEPGTEESPLHLLLGHFEQSRDGGGGVTLDVAEQEQEAFGRGQVLNGFFEVSALHVSVIEAG
jgi:hypothetical protein